MAQVRAENGLLTIFQSSPVVGGNFFFRRVCFFDTLTPGKFRESVEQKSVKLCAVFSLLVIHG